jgi:hypothetical protein
MEIEQVGQAPGALWAEMVLLNGVLSLLAAVYFRRTGFWPRCRSISGRMWSGM